MSFVSRCESSASDHKHNGARVSTPLSLPRVYRAAAPQSAPLASGRHAKTVVIFVLDFVSRCITAVLSGPSMRILVCHPEPSESWSVTTVCRAFRGTGRLPSSLFQTRTSVPWAPNKHACIQSHYHTVSSTLVVRMVKNLPADSARDWVQSLS